MIKKTFDLWSCAWIYIWCLPIWLPLHLLFLIGASKSARIIKDSVTIWFIKWRLATGLPFWTGASSCGLRNFLVAQSVPLTAGRKVIKPVPTAWPIIQHTPSFQGKTLRTANALCSYFFTSCYHKLKAYSRWVWVSKVSGSNNNALSNSVLLSSPAWPAKLLVGQ